MSLLLALLLSVGDDPLAPILAKLRETAAKAVVAIEVERDADPDGITGSGSVAQHRDYYNRPKGPTSGVIYEADGFILTSRFNVSGTLRKNGIKVTLWDGRQLVAAFVGSDEQRDIALHAVVARVGDYHVARGGEGALDIGGDAGVHGGEEQARGVAGLALFHGEIGYGLRQSAREVPSHGIAILLPRGAVASADPLEVEPRVALEEFNEVLTHHAGGAENTYFDSRLHKSVTIP